MVLMNAPDSFQDIYFDYYDVPTIHVDLAGRSEVLTYITSARGTATATLGLSYTFDGVVAPAIADFSSRGPFDARANGCVLSPMLTAPGEVGLVLA